MNKILEARRIYFIGIGGIGISALARFFLSRGAVVGGCNESLSGITTALAEEGISIDIGQSLELIPRDVELIIYSNAIKVAAPDFLNQVQSVGVPTLSYPEALGLISLDYYTIAIAGTHGKTTTTAMLAKIMIEAGLDPTVIVGTLLLDTPGAKPTNFVAGQSRYLLLEADEYQRAFLNLSPKLLVITNVDLDHLDYYRDLADIQSAFHSLVQQVPVDGALIYSGRQVNLESVLLGAKCSSADYSLVETTDLRLKVPGRHNVENAQAALAAAQVLGVSFVRALEALGKFGGTWRRFEFKGQTKAGALVYDDYAHNPQKVKAALQGAREAFPNKKIFAVFQPHLYSRTKALFDGFVAAFDEADEVIIAPIYAAREKPDPSVSAVALAEAIQGRGPKAVYLADFESIADQLQAKVGSGDLILLLGAGDISQLSDSLL